MLSARKNVKNVYINEDLTEARAKLFSLARKKKKDGQVHKCWIYDGKLFLRLHPDGKQQAVKNIQHFNDLLDHKEEKVN